MVKYYTWKEIKNPKNKWIVLNINNHLCVLDVEQWIPNHPGGPDILIRHLNKDATKDFEAIGHGQYVYKTLLPKYYIGEVKK
jgi:cytochrome b involved in lipid metabolism